MVKGKSTESPTSDIAMPASLAEQYRYISTLGRGGMAVVVLVESVGTGTRLALKRLLPCEGASHAARAQELFEREYLTLAQISHPCIVKVHDFGIADGVSYYTMEPVEGGDLGSAGIQPWRAVCQLGRELCSALSLLHSRRCVYRDLSPNNILFSASGRATLIDFGATAEMGKAHVPVCTPAVAAPELLQSQPIDGRADLFALGASLYFALTGRHAFPARKFSQLAPLWQNPPRPPSRYASDIPDALDRLVLDLLQIEADLRPINAGEVAEQLCVIGKLAEDTRLQGSSAYLTTPRLVGRKRPLSLLRKHMERLAATRKGASVVIAGASGVGRTRLLEAAYLEASIQGMSTIRGSAASARGGPFGAVRAMAHELVTALPDVAVAAAAPNWQVLTEVIPELRDFESRRPAQCVEDIEEVTAPALRAWICRLAAIQPATILVDDVHRLDAESQALLALLASDAHDHPYLLVTSLLEGPDNEALGVLRRSSSVEAIGLLPIKDSGQLLTSIFGQVPNLPYVVNRLHQISHGNPQGLMRLAQHMLNVGICERQDGGWVLPEFVDSKQIPEDMTAALTAMTASLDASSRKLAAMLGACENLTFSLTECCQLMEPASRANVVAMIDELVAASVFEPSDGDACLAGQAWSAALPLADGTTEETHQRLAAVFSARGDGVRAARFFASAELPDKAVDALLEFSETTLQVTDSDSTAYVRLLLSVPSDWASVFCQTIEIAVERNASDHNLYLLRSRMLGLASPTIVAGGAAMDWLGTRLAKDCGLDLLPELPPDTPADKRLPMALEQAAARNLARSPDRQLFAPAEAIPALCRTMIAGVSNLSNTLDVAAWDRMPSLSPLAPLSPAIDLIDQLARGFDARIKGRLGRAREIYVGVIDALDLGLARGTLKPTYADTMKSGVSVIIGLMDAALGLPSWEHWLRIVGEQQLHQASCLSIRVVKVLWEGNSKLSETIEQQRILRKLEYALPQAFESVALIWRAAAYAIMGDIARLGELRKAIANMVERSPTWQPVLNWIQGECATARGDHLLAVREQEAALQLMGAAAHGVWPWAAASLIRAKMLTGDLEGAVQTGERLVNVGQQVELGHPIIYAQMALAEALAAHGESEAAHNLTDKAVEMVEALGASGLLPGTVHESAAKVALALGDDAAFYRHFGACRQVYGKHRNRALRSRLKTLSAERTRTCPQEHALEDADMSLEPTLGGTTEWLSELESADTRESRIAFALNIAVSECNGVAACFLGWADDGPVVVAESAEFKAPPKALQIFRTTLSEAIEPMVTSTGDFAEETHSDRLEFAELAFHPELVSHETPDGTIVSGLLVLEVTPETDVSALSRLTPVLSRVLTDIDSLTVMTIVE